jgi:hypothetical protein
MNKREVFEELATNVLVPMRDDGLHRKPYFLNLQALLMALANELEREEELAQLAAKNVGRA